MNHGRTTTLGFPGKTTGAHCLNPLILSSPVILKIPVILSVARDLCISSGSVAHVGQGAQP
jgi:hypothetical protein